MGAAALLDPASPSSKLNHDPKKKEVIHTFKAEPLYH
jgi:hypothetical protein